MRHYLNPMLLKRRDEEFAREAITRFLCPPFQEPELEWNPHEAPDWILKLGDQVLGVEVTWVTGTTELDGKPVLNRTVSASLTQWAEALRREVEAEPWFAGLYILSMRPIPNLGDHGPHLRDQVLTYADETRHLAEAPPKRLPGGWSIGKYRGSTNQLSYSYSVGTDGRIGEITVEAERLISSAILRKESLLKTSKMPIALALVDDFHFAGVDIWREVAQNADMTSAACLFRVHGEYECDLLAGKDLREPSELADSAAPLDNPIAG